MKIFFVSLFIVLFMPFAGLPQTRPNTITLISIPENEEEFRNIFKRNPRKGEMEDLASIYRDMKSREDVVFLQGPEDLESIGNRMLKSETGKELPRIGFFLIGHNEGGVFHFPDGGAIALMDVKGKLQGAEAMFLTCNASSYIKRDPAIGYTLTYREAIEIARDINDISFTCDIYIKTTRDVAEEMIAKLNQRHQVKYIVKFLAAAGGLTGSFVLLKKMDEDAPDEKVDSLRSSSGN
ncbi:MAG: hypothetical protein QHC79_25765 [Pseudosphingobacterium sp.]|nr:hypothetical protein [Pseudosphingobacterium sp.]